MNNEGTRKFTRRDFLKLAGLFTAGATIAACTPEPVANALLKPSATPFKDNRPQPIATPEYGQFTTDAAWLWAFNKLGTSFQKELGLLEKTIPDPFIRNRVAEVLIGNRIKAMKGGELSIYSMQLDAGLVIGMEPCADSRIVCKTAFYSASEGTTIVTSQQGALGAAPRVFDKGINVSILATHATDCNEATGCGALAGLAELEKAGGYNTLRKHGISDDTIRLIQNSLHSANPDEQAIIGAKVQAMINSTAHDGAGHITVAVKMGHADGSMKILGAYDQLGNAVPVPKVVNEYVAFNVNSPIMNDARLALGQAPVEFTINTTKFNTTDLMDDAASTAGHTFKIAVKSQGGVPNQLLNVSTIDDGVAAANYPLAHPQWGKLQWVFGRNPEDLALMRERLLASDNAWGFLGRQGVIVEALVDDTGKISTLNVTQMAKIPRGVQTVEALKKIGVASAEITLSQKTLAEAEILAEANIANVSKWKSIIEGLKTMGKVGIKILNVLQPVFNAGLVISAADTWQQITDRGIVFEEHSSLYTDGRTGDIVKVISDEEYYSQLNKNKNIEPYMGAQLYSATITQAQLALSYKGAVDKFIGDIDAFGGTITDGPKSDKSVFYGVGIADLYKIMGFDYLDFNEKPRKTQKFLKPGKPLIFLPLPVQNKFSPKHFDLREEEIIKQPFMMLNTETGESLTTVTPGEMIVPVESTTPRNPAIKVTYFLYMKSDGEGRITVKPIGYKEQPNKTSGLSGNEVAESGSIPVNSLFGHIFPRKESVTVS